MKNNYKRLSAAVLGLVLLSPAQAIVVSSTFWGATDASQAASFAGLAGLSFSNVVRLNIGSNGTCTGSLISATTILTAKHCTSGVAATNILVDFDENGDGQFNGSDLFGQSLNPITGIFNAPDPAIPDLTDGTDLALLTMNDLFVVPSWVTSYQRLWDGNVLGSLVAMVGYGGQGVDVLTDPAAGKSRWAAQNVVDEVGQAYDPRGASPGYRANSANIISTDFDNPVGQGFPPFGTGNSLAAQGSSPSALDLEGTTAGGDSGGPLLVYINDEWLIAGVLSGGGGPDAAGPDITFGDVSWWTGVSPFRSEITARGGVFVSATQGNSVPEPGSLALALGALFAVSTLGKRRRAH